MFYKATDCFPLTSKLQVIKRKSLSPAPVAPLLSLRCNLNLKLAFNQQPEIIEALTLPWHRTHKDRRNHQDGDRLQKSVVRFFYR